MRRYPVPTSTRSPEEVAARRRALEARLAPPGPPVIEVGEGYIRIIADKCPPNLNREHLPNVRRRALGPSRWSVSTDWSQWAIQWGGQARIQAGWPIACAADKVRLVVTLHRTTLLDPLDNKGNSVKPVIDGLQRVWKRRRIAKGVVAEEPGAGLIDDDRTLDEDVCKVRQVKARRAEQHMVIEVWREPGAAR